MLDSLVKLWNKLEIRVLVISSLSIQILLLGLAGFRKYVISFRYAQTTAITWRGPLALMFHWFLWFVYLMADYVAIVALAYLKSIDKASPQSKTHQLLMFWAPFFLLHLGGQDTITGLSIEDNDLWSRQLLTLLSQVALVIYNYSTSNVQIGELWPPAALMFAVAIFKYGERIWCLKRASMSGLWSSMIRQLDPGPNYLKFMQEYISSKDAGLTAQIKIEMRKGDMESQQTQESEERKSLKYAEVVCKAYKFFPIYKRLFVDLNLTNRREALQMYFEGLGYGDAYKLIEIELSWMYDIFHSKCSVIYAFRHYGWVSRVITLVITTAALCLFAMSDHTGYGQFETTLTYVLLVGAVGLEFLALFFMLLSFWTYAVMKESGSCSALSDFHFSILKKLRPQGKPRWSDKMAQYSLITYSLEDQPCWLKNIIELVGFKETWDHYRYTTYVTVNEGLKKLVFLELKNIMKDTMNTAPNRGFTSNRGQWVIQRKGYDQIFGWSVEVDFDESIMLWHIATNLLFLDPEKPVSTSEEQEWEPEREISQHISNYMMFLLIERPFMMPDSTWQIPYGDTCEAMTHFFSNRVL